MNMKNSGVEWIGEIPESWTTGKIKYFSTISAGGTPNRNIDEFWNGEINWMSSGEINQRKVKYTAEKITEIGLKSSAAKMLPIGTVMLALNGQGKTKGMAAILEIETSSNQSLAAFQTDEKNLHSRYLWYYLLANYKNIRAMKGEERDGLNLQLVSNIQISLPNLTEQKAIADYLDKQSVKFDKAEKLLTAEIDRLRAYKKSLIYETVTKGLDKTAPLKDSGVDWIGEIPVGWERIRMGYLGDVKNGLTYSPNDVTDERSGTLVLRSSNIQNDKLSFENNVYVRTKIDKSIMMQKNDILITSRNGSARLIGKNAIVEDEINATYGAFMMVFRANERVLPKFSYYLMNSSFEYYRTFFTTSTINQLTAGIFKNMQVAIPPSLAEQKEIAGYLDEKTNKIDHIIKIKEQQLTNLSEQRKTLIYEVVTGKRRV